MFIFGILIKFFNLGSNSASDTVSNKDIGSDKNINIQPLCLDNKSLYIPDNIFTNCIIKSLYTYLNT